jgi:hypothetical protein
MKISLECDFANFPGTTFSFYGCDILVGTFCCVLSDLIVSTNDSAFAHAFLFTLADIIEISIMMQVCFLP